jgi:hypothetical protein
MPTCSDVGEPQIYVQIYVKGVAAENSGSLAPASGLSAHFAPTPLIGSVHQMH